MKQIIIAFVTSASSILAFIPSGHATDFNFSYTFDLGTTINGSFDGTQNGNIITNISSVAISVDGTQFNDNGNLTIFSWDNRWVAGGAQISIDGKQNNFQFTDAPLTNILDFSNQFFAITGAASTYLTAPPEIAYGIKGTSINGYEGLGDFPPNSSWDVTVVGTGPVAVPGPIAGAGLPALLGLFGFGLYRRRSVGSV